MGTNKYECKKEGNIVAIEINKIGNKGTKLMKLYPVNGQETVTKEIIKNIIINIGL